MSTNGPSVTHPPPVAPGTAKGDVSGGILAPFPPKPVRGSHSGDARKLSASRVQSQYLFYSIFFEVSKLFL